MRVWIMTPYSVERNLGKAYNEAMAMIPENDAACFIDGDCMFCTSDFGSILDYYANLYTRSVLTCHINRIHQLAKGQLYSGFDDVKACIAEANRIKHVRTVTNIVGSVSGTLLVVPKSIWNKYKFIEVNAYRPGEPNLLGCDNHYTNLVRANGISVLRMDGLLIYHQYRLLTGTKDHLL